MNNETYETGEAVRSEKRDDETPFYVKAMLTLGGALILLLLAGALGYTLLECYRHYTMTKIMERVSREDPKEIIEHNWRYR